MNVPSEYAIIEQGRKPPKYTQSTFSNYQKTQVSKALIKAIEKISLEEVCHWTIELHCSGQIESLILNLTYLVSERINIENPLLPKWWWNRIKKYIRIKNLFGKSTMFINSRNNQEMRNLLAEMSVMLTMAEKNNSFVTSKLPKINTKYFKSFNYQNKILKKNTDHIIKFYLEEDYRAGLNIHENLVIAFQQYVNHIYSSNYENCGWWIMWIFIYDKTSKYQNLEAPIKSQKNSILSDLNDKLDWVWIFWDFLLRYINQFHSNHYHNKIHIKEQVEALYYMYMYGLTKANKSKKVVHLLNAISYIKKNVDWSIPLISNKKELYLVQITANINLLYKRINTNRDNYIGEQISKNLYQNQLESQIGIINRNEKYSQHKIKDYQNKKIDKYETQGNNNSEIKVKVSKKKLEEEERERKQHHLNKQFDLIDQLLKNKTNTRYESENDYIQQRNRKELEQLNMKTINNPYYMGYNHLSKQKVNSHTNEITKEVDHIQSNSSKTPILKSININTSDIPQIEEFNYNNQNKRRIMTQYRKVNDNKTRQTMRHSEFIKRRQEELKSDEDYISDQYSPDSYYMNNKNENENMNIHPLMDEKDEKDEKDEMDEMDEMDENIEINNINDVNSNYELVNSPDTADAYLPHMYLNDGNDYPQNITDDEDYGWE